MAGLAPFFLSGGNGKIRINNRTIAFCSQIEYTIDTPHVNPKVLGMYEGPSIEPTGYSVTGSFTIIKYTAGMAELHDAQHGGKLPSGVSIKGNGVGSWGPDGVEGVVGTLGAGSGDGQAHQSLQPQRLNNSMMFDIEVYQKGPHGDDNPVARLKNCRITKASFLLPKKGIATQAFQFMAVYADEDTFVTSPSGVGQHLG